VRTNVWAPLGCLKKNRYVVFLSLSSCHVVLDDSGSHDGGRYVRYARFLSPDGRVVWLTEEVLTDV
jgi:hypothetical protein